MRIHDKFKENIKTASVVISLVFTVISVGISVVNYYILNQLQPIDYRIKAVEKTEADLTADHNYIKENFATKETQNDIIHRLDIISGRLDGLIARFVK